MSELARKAIADLLVLKKRVQEANSSKRSNEKMREKLPERNISDG